MSILSFPKRSHHGKANWRGNCNGEIYKALFNQYKVKSMCDPMVGSGTSLEVAEEMNIPVRFGLDLHSGFNILKDSIVDTIGQQVEFCVSHPAYHDMIIYSGEVWGEAHPDDLSRCASEEDFIEKLHQALLNQREATLPSKFYGLIMGDMRRAGKYSCFTSDMIARLPKSELATVLIKGQHNVMSDSKSYGKTKHPFIQHEYIVLWEKPKTPLSLLLDLSTMAKQQASTIKSIWKAVIKQALVSLGGKSDLSKLYAKISQSAPEKLKENQHWEAQVRKVLQTYSDFVNIERGVWGLA